MYSVMVIDRDKLKKARGGRTQEDIVLAALEAGAKFSVQQLSAWEKGLYRPRPHLVPGLLTALGVPFERIATPLGGKPQQIAA